MESHLFGVLLVRPRGPQTGAAIWHQFWYRGLAPQRWIFRSLVLHTLHRRAEAQPAPHAHIRCARGATDRFCTHARIAALASRLRCAASACRLAPRGDEGAGANLAEAQTRPVSQPFRPRLHVRNCVRRLRSQGIAKARFQRQLCVTLAAPPNKRPRDSTHVRVEVGSCMQHNLIDVMTSTCTS